jgi:hypothetical protein
MTTTRHHDAFGHFIPSGSDELSERSGMNTGLLPF